MCKGQKEGDYRLVKVLEKVEIGGGGFGIQVLGDAKVDTCIADLVQALNHMGIATRMSCCGDGKRNGYIWLEDRRLLLILDAEHSRMIDDAVINKHQGFNLHDIIEYYKRAIYFPWTDDEGQSSVYPIYCKHCEVKIGTNILNSNVEYQYMSFQCPKCKKYTKVVFDKEEEGEMVAEVDR